MVAWPREVMMQSDDIQTLEQDGALGGPQDQAVGEEIIGTVIPVAIPSDDIVVTTWWNSSTSHGPSFVGWWTPVCMTRAS
jgi:hypothetical protein